VEPVEVTPGRASAPPVVGVGIVGLGLIGGSIAAGLRRAWPTVAVTGVDRPEILSAAMDRGAITARAGSVADLAGADLVILAAPVGAILGVMDEAARLGPRCVVTDVGSTKRQIMREAARAGVPRFVGGHPMAGAARGGFDRARPDLFKDQTWLLVADVTCDADAYAQVESVVRALGARPVRIGADAHDRAMAYVSHLPQLVSTGLMAAAGRAVGDAGLRVAGPGFTEVTRLASSGADVWADILATNADCIADALGALVASLPAGDRDLRDPRWVSAMFEQAQGWRERLVHLPRTAE
jgi:prephenate dehydrogenase